MAADERIGKDSAFPHDTTRDLIHLVPYSSTIDYFRTNIILHDHFIARKDSINPFWILPEPSWTKQERNAATNPQNPATNPPRKRRSQQSLAVDHKIQDRNIHTIRKMMLFRLITTLLLLHMNNSALAVDDKDRHERDDEDRDINDEGEDTEFTCNVLDGKFRDTSGPHAVLTYGYEMEYRKGRSPIYLSNRVTDFIGQDIISSVFEGCKDFDYGRRMQASIASSLPSSFHDEGEFVGSVRSMASAGSDLIVGFETTPNVTPIWEVECSEPNPEHDCMIFRGGITIYFPDSKRGRSMQEKVRMDFSEISEEDRVIQEIHDIVKNTIESGNIPDKILAIKKLTYKLLPVTDEPTGKPSAPPTVQPSTFPSSSPSNSPSFEPSAMSSHSPTEEPTSKLSEEGTPPMKVISKIDTSIEDSTSTKVQIGPWAWTLLGVSLLICSIMGGIYVKKRQQNKAAAMRRQQAEEEDDDMEAEDVVLNSQISTSDMIQPLTTEEGKIEVVLDEEKKLSEGASGSEDLC